MPSPPTAAEPPARATVVFAEGADFFLADAPGVTGVRLELDFSIEPVDPEFVPIQGGWSLHLPRPAVDRLEYQFTVRADDGTGGVDTSWIPDPGNPSRVPNPFGDKSEILFPGYRPPAWLGTPDTGTLSPVACPPGELDEAVPTTMWSPAGLAPDTAAALLLVHDGSDMAARGGLPQWASSAIAGGVRPFRIALLDPAAGRRDQWYAADEQYADHLATVLVPGIGQQVLVSAIVGLGASLGALAMLFGHSRHPGLLDAVALQSGSYFTAALDPQESGYERFQHICSAVSALAAGPAAQPVPVLITCGIVEENRANNEQLATALQGQGYRVEVHLVPDAHTMIGWRDAWSPGLERLLDTVTVAGQP
jgi:enterochelin esterase-like enzyme